MDSLFNEKALDCLLQFIEEMHLNRNVRVSFEYIAIDDSIDSLLITNSKVNYIQGIHDDQRLIRN